MVSATAYPFVEILWTMVIFFAGVVWIGIAIMVLVDVFSRPDISGWAKAGWTACMAVLPFVGVLIYLITNGSSMSGRRVA